MYRLNLKITTKNSEKCKQVKRLNIEKCETLKKVIDDGADFLKVLSIPNDVIVEFLETVNVSDVVVEQALKYKYYIKDLEGSSLKVEIDITKTI